MALPTAFSKLSLTFRPSSLTESSELKQQCDRTYTQLPDCIRLHSNDILDPDLPSRTIYVKLLVRMDCLLNIFHLERLLVRYGRSDGQGLLDVAKEMLSLKLVFWKQRDRLVGMQSAFEFIVRWVQLTI